MKRIINYTLFFLVLVVMAIVYAAPDWIVDPPVKSASALTPTALVTPEVTPPAADPQPTAPESPDNGAVAPQPTNDGVVTPPVVTPPATAPAYNPDSVLNDGFGNYCYQMDDGSWTTVIYKGPGGGTMYPYAGPTDPHTDAPLTASGSQQWCSEHASV